MPMDRKSPQIDELLRANLIEQALEAQKRSYCPYSKFPVGSALLTASGQIFPGVNVENASYGGTICAERSALVSAVSALGPDNLKVKAMAVVANTQNPSAPCGICRQFLSEFGDFPVIMHSPLSSETEIRTVLQLLPEAFTKDSLK